MASFNKEDSISFAWTIVLILFIRAFIVEPFKIPSGSMIPTLLVGDHLFVAKGSYDIGIPFTTQKLFRVSDPKRGDVVVFEYPNNESDPAKDGLYYIKRVIGIPGDEISVKGGIPFVNGQRVAQEGLTSEPDPKLLPNFSFNPNNQLLTETLPGMDHAHWVQRYPFRLQRLPDVLDELRAQSGKDCIEAGKAALGQLPLFDSVMLNEICTFRVPEGEYFVMGDNRDDSADGREWGMVERKLLKGRALFIWASLFKDPTSSFFICVPGFNCSVHWNRIGLGIL